jgi:hypothetical protein
MPKVNVNISDEGTEWRRAKARIITTHGTIRSLAQHLGCHYNSIRLAFGGRCPRLLPRIEEALHES